MKEIELPQKIKDSVIRLYIEKVSPFNNGAYNKNVYLDQCIEDLYITIESKKLKKHGEIEKMKKQIEKLTEIAEQIEDGGEEGVENIDDEEGQGKKYIRKTKMCEATLEQNKMKTIKSMTNKIEAQKEEKCKNSKKWEFSDVKEAKITYPGMKKVDSDEVEVEGEETKKKHFSKCEHHYQDPLNSNIHKLSAEPRKCKDAHNPIELDLVTLKKDV